MMHGNVSGISEETAEETGGSGGADATVAEGAANGGYVPLIEQRFKELCQSCANFYERTLDEHDELCFQCLTKKSRGAILDSEAVDEEMSSLRYRNTDLENFVVDIADLLEVKGGEASSAVMERVRARVEASQTRIKGAEQAAEDLRDTIKDALERPEGGHEAVLLAALGVAP